MENPDVYQEHILVTKNHLDELNHVNNVQYLQWIQDVAQRHWESKATELWLQKYAWVALNHFI